MSGYYNYHPTIDEPGSFPVQTASQQKPFYFGGSQVPVNLGINNTNLHIQGNGLKHIHKTVFRPRTSLRKY
jgi:hypothetical protein